MPAPTRTPLGLHLARTAKVVSRQFETELAGAGGSVSTWLILLSLKTRPIDSQRDLAAAIGLHGATLTHHLDGLESRGLVTRHRDPDDRRNQRLQLTEEGQAAFLRLRTAATRFDQRLRAGLTADELDLFHDVLNRVVGNLDSE